MSVCNDRAAWLKAGDVVCAGVPAGLTKTYRLVLLGAPGVGKGTQAGLLSQGLGACQLSTGDVFRAAKRASNESLSPSMKLAVAHMQKGELVPDDTVVAMIRERMRCLTCSGGFLLDGFPRTVPQAEELEELLVEEQAPLHAVISYDLPMDTIVARLAGRRTCEACKAVYHVDTSAAARAGTCDACGGKVYQREDDQPDVIRVRMEAYQTSTEPLIAFYRNRHLLMSVSAAGTPEQIYQRTLWALADLG